ncbi:hypothetical protein SteCoe_9919 [Stentor coeruleus]|uniref:Uncharacterized protein n=1 Tax=Stentor coeruleus TaxID=5963 RepID=A0A1R2CGW3_9CILI|nr:hypothetical protein SteCoe_9919 [Stentor coeruleus]
MEQNYAKVCRVCFEDESETKKVISPCLCKGSSKYIHEECLYTWITSQAEIKEINKCEICNFKYNIEVKIAKKCSPKVGILENLHLVCYLAIIFLVISILSILVFFVVSKNYVDPNESIVYFLGIISVFVFSLLCSCILVFKLIKQICWVTVREAYKILPAKSEDLDLNTTQLVHSLPRVETVREFGPVTIMNEIVDNSLIYVEHK